MRILIADRDSEFRDEVGTDLRALGPVSVVQSARTPELAGRDGLSLDLVFLDFALIAQLDHPLAWLREMPVGAPPVVIVVDQKDDSQAAAVKAAGAAGYLSRQEIDSRQLRRCITEVLPKRASHPTSTPRSESSRTRLPTVAGYRVIRPIGSGGSSSVYLAQSEEAGERLVLKILNAASNEEHERLQQRFAREYRIVASLNKRNIVDIYDFVVDETLSYLAIEYFPCGDLGARMRNPMAVGDSLSYLRQIAGALKVIHDVSVLHRDLKPANLMLREDNTIALIDFGLAKPLDTADSVTATGELRGTPFYISPEQLLSGEVDQRSDLYSLGVIFYEMLMGEPPYVGDRVLEVLEQHVHRPIPALPRELGALQSLLEKLLAKDPAQRVKSADEVLQLAASERINFS